MKKLVFIFAVGFMVSCSSENSNAADSAVSSESVAATHNASSKLSIEGMTCEIGCVRTIQSRLAKMPGVLNINMDFDTARATNYSTIDFDNSIVSEEDMKDEIESIANGIYAVTDISSIRQ